MAHCRYRIKVRYGIIGCCLGLIGIMGCQKPQDQAPELMPPEVVKPVQPLSDYVSPVWVSDRGDGRYRNPVLFADYSEPDVCRVDSDFYMAASSYGCLPGLPILHSKDLVNWQLIGHALPSMSPDENYNQTHHSQGAWAPCIRYHNGLFYLYWGDPDLGICLVCAENPAGPWSKPIVVKAGLGLIDPCPLWDDDGQTYLIHAWDSTRAEINGLMTVCKMNEDGTKVLDQGRHVIDGHGKHPSLQGPKWYKHNEYYYILAPGGGPSQGWQIAFRSKQVYGPYEDKIVLAQGTTKVNGPHQGAWVTTALGESWFVHGQERSPYGRVVHLEPLEWIQDWPVIGADKDGNGCGEPVLIHAKPNVGQAYPIMNPVESDEFNDGQLGLQWQWCANPNICWSVMLPEKDYLRLFAIQKPEDALNFWDVPNLLLQKMPSPSFSATTKLTFTSPGPGRQARLIVLGRDYAFLSMSGNPGSYVLTQVVCKNADKGGNELIEARAFVSLDTVYLRVEISEDEGQALFSYSLDGLVYTNLGPYFDTREGGGTGAKVGLFCVCEPDFGRGGYADFDWFRIDK